MHLSKGRVEKDGRARQGSTLFTTSCSPPLSSSLRSGDSARRSADTPVCALSNRFFLRRPPSLRGCPILPRLSAEGWGLAGALPLRGCQRKGGDAPVCDSRPAPTIFGADVRMGGAHVAQPLLVARLGCAAKSGDATTPRRAPAPGEFTILSVYPK
jgi:hypothetical protein